MLDANLKNQLKAYLEKVTQPFEIVASLDDGAKSRELLGLLEDISSLTDKITLHTDGQDSRTPSFAINRPGEETGVVFAGIDVIGGMLIEVNITSPTGLQELTRFDGRPYHEEIIASLE